MAFRILIINQNSGFGCPLNEKNTYTILQERGLSDATNENIPA